jgi:hypothetical protein
MGFKIVTKLRDKMDEKEELTRKKRTDELGS